MTKSIRLLPEEAEELAILTKRAASTEAALMKKWILQGIRQQKMDDAIRAYMVRDVDLRAGAAMAGVSYNRFLREVQARNIVILDDDNFIEHLAALAQTVGSDILSEAVDALAMQVAGAVPSEDAG